ncbi:MAG TPA: DUF5615 family PIN-like protein [Pirellulaceae bacterium]|nr:DUF5615 family PIN-like protein [Pirellulaceae bacterium]
MEIRYHLDESVPNAIANGLRLRGIDVTTTKDAGLLEAPDDQQLAYAHANHRVIVSFDDDFLVLASQGVEHSGIAYCHQRERSIGQVVNGLVSLWRQRTREDMAWQTHYL